MKGKRLSIVGLLSCVCIAVVGVCRPAEIRADALDLLETDISSWRLEKARARLEKLGEDARSLPRAMFLKGELLFYEGDATAAVESLRRAVEGNRSEPLWKAVRDRAADTARVFDTLERIDGPSKRFVYRLDPALDGLLIPYAEETLLRQLEVLSRTFGDKPVRPIEVVFVSRSRDLAALSGLSREQIERTGTVGVTKYGRVMMLSPRSLVSGYPWLDTLAHELTHYVVTRASLDRVPIWLHEGISKLLECRWREASFQTLSPEEAYLLDRAVTDGRLIPLRRFHPSVAFLSDQEEAASAYAQTLSFTKYLSDRLPADWLKRLTRGLAAGTPLDHILRSMGDADLQRMYNWWRKSASGKHHTPPPAVGMMKKRFKQGAVAGTGSGDSLHALEVRKHLRLGDLLRLRGHTVAAVQEFEKAEKLAQFTSPEISDRLGAALIEVGDFRRAQVLLKKITALYPSHAGGFVQLARACAGLTETAEAAAAFRAANAINPFDPEIHCSAAELYRELGDSEAAARENRSCRAALQVQKKSEDG